jgi:hypothetical protein
MKTTSEKCGKNGTLCTKKSKKENPDLSGFFNYKNQENRKNLHEFSL